MKDGSNAGAAESLPPISLQIWKDKYRFTPADGWRDGDETIEDTWRRVAKALAEPEKRKDRAVWEQCFYEAMEGFKFLPGGRIIAGAGTKRSVTLMNCYVGGDIPDSMSGIFEHLREAALTLQQGGGIGYNFSTIRPKGAVVAGVGADASGPMSFMDVWDAMCRTVMSAGSRRGAMMGHLRCDHPDIEAFVEAKRDPAKLRMFNLSVLVTDPFMEAVRDDKQWDLQFDGRVYRTISARDLWEKIMRATYDVAEPGVIFIDRINKLNNLWYAEEVTGTNPCGEIPLPQYGSCLLGSINLATLIEHPFQRNAYFNEPKLYQIITPIVRMMDNVIDVTRFPLPQQKAQAEAKRRLGLGVTGLADALLMLGVEYGSNEACLWTETVMHMIRKHAYRASIELAKEKGAFPLFDAKEFLAGENVATLDADTLAGIEEHGLRNGLLTSIQPTGTISLLAGNVSSGIEPIFAPSYRRKVLQPDGSKREEEVVDYAVQMWRDTGATMELPPAYVDAQSLPPEAHLLMQAAAQKYVDNAISKTINLPEDIPFKEFMAVYQQAYDLGCKGCTTYRPNEVTGSVISVEKPVAAAPTAPAVHPLDNPDMTAPPEERPEAMIGVTYKLRWPESAHAIYITINDLEAGPRRRPFEVFINSKNMEHYAWTVALTRMISAVFRRGGDVSFVVEELKAVFDPRGGAWHEGRYVPSILAAIGGVIERHMRDTGFLAGGENLDIPKGDIGRAPSVVPIACSACGSFNVRMDGGCAICNDCGHSKCS